MPLQPSMPLLTTMASVSTTNSTSFAAYCLSYENSDSNSAEICILKVINWFTI